MEPLYTRAQKLKVCNVCKTEMAQVYCNTCHVKLCYGCFGKHMDSDELKKKHEIERIDRKSKPFYTYPSCTSHNKERCEIYCQECDKPICITCITSNQHSGHEFMKILKVLNEKKEKIIKELNELKDPILPKYQNIASDLEDMIKELEKGYYEDLSDSITKHGEEWCNEIKKVVTKLKAEVDEMKNKHFEILKSQLNEINEKISEIRERINTINPVNINSQDILELFGIPFNMDKCRQPPQNLALSFPTFIPMTIQGEKLSSLFGTISPSKLTSERYSYSSHSVKQLLDEPEITATIYTNYQLSLYNVACLSDDKIWTSGKENTMRLYSVILETCLSTIPTKSGNIPTDIAVTEQGNLVYTDPRDRTVNIVKNEEIETLIILKEWEPHYICYTSSGDLLVVMVNDDSKESRVVRYSGSTERQIIHFDDKGCSLYSSYSSGTTTKYITDNRNQDICVADEGAKAVVVVNQAGKLRFRYTGHFAAQMNNHLQPKGITTDIQGHILTADKCNHCVHILDQDGQFLRHINCGLSYPWGLCVDTSDDLFVIESDFKLLVKKVEYMR
ncbi:uncharacterized protein LOC134251835 [Saccostrea cucullata]|uniref:uncharacterized protein LOC134251835 n=1 Tax=Saccostrea cuccullata TaxID=36930 RepID=UPI002ED22EAB